MEYNRERTSLNSGKLIECFRDGKRRRMRNMIGHLSPATISHIVDITVSAVYVAATGNFHQNGIYFDHFPVSTWLLVNANGCVDCGIDYRRRSLRVLRYVLLLSIARARG